MNLLTKNNTPVNFVQQKAKCNKGQKIKNGASNCFFINHNSPMKNALTICARIFRMNSSNTSSSTNTKKQSREAKEKRIEVSSKADTSSHGDNDNNKRNEHNNIPPVSKIKFSRYIKHGRFVSSNIVRRHIVAQLLIAHLIHTSRFLLPLPCCGFASAHKHLPVCIGLLIRVVGWHRPSQGRKSLTLNMMVSKLALALWGAVKKYTASSFLIPKIEVAK